MPTDADATCVRLHDITMDFPGHRALDGVGTSFRFDEVHGLIGENGAGKSTLVNVLGGSLAPTRGAIHVAGRSVMLRSPRDARAHGIAHVSQEGSLVPAFSGAANVLLGDEPTRFGGILRSRALGERAQALLTHWFPEASIPLDRAVDSLSVADQKVLEIVRALRGEPRLLILDEPTATLQSREKAQLWSIIRSLPARGVGVVLISHFLSEIKALSNRITVLRDGRQVGCLKAASVDESWLVDLMLRRDAGDGDGDRQRAPTAEACAPGPVVLEAQDWSVGEVRVPHFALRRGEIVGLIGLTGAGHFEFARSLYTREHIASGRIAIDGAPITAPGIRAMQRSGVAFVPDRRMENALFADGSVTANLAMVHPEFATAGAGVVLRRRTERDEIARVVSQLGIRRSSDAQNVSLLSGGNKQKVSLGKWLYGAQDRYRVMILIEPTEGVDIGAKQEIYAHARRLAERGAGVLIASSDLLEIEQLTDRVIPFVQGRAQVPIERIDYSEATFIAAIAGAAA